MHTNFVLDLERGTVASDAIPINIITVVVVIVVLFVHKNVTSTTHTMNSQANKICKAQ